MTGEAIEVIRPFLDAANVDLKSFSEETYKHVCKASLEPVLESIRLMKKAGIWVEVTTLVVPGLNDGQEELRNIAGFIAGIDPGIPWHISRFHPDYKYTDTPPTPLRTMRTASDLGREQGLRFIYLGNVWGEAENTCCPQCGLLLIRRQGYSVEEIHIQDSRCPRCRNLIPGVFLRA
jgi:pyruvate formate lyase activating enzyme